MVYKRIIIWLIAVSILLIIALMYLIWMDKKLTFIEARQHGIEVFINSHSDSIYKSK